MPENSTIPLLKRRLKKTLDIKRYNHSLRVADLAVKIAEICGVNPQDAYLAGLLHDCEKTHDIPAILALAKKYNMRLTSEYKKSPLLLHGPLGAITARKKYGVQNRQILNAIKNHTTGRKGMGKLEKIIYVADFVEPQRKLAEVRQIREKLLRDGDLDQAVLSKARLVLKLLKLKNRG